MTITTSELVEAPGVYAIVKVDDSDGEPQSAVYGYLPDFLAVVPAILREWRSANKTFLSAYLRFCEVDFDTISHDDDGSEDYMIQLDD